VGGTSTAPASSSVDATVALRLWDIDPAGTATLITRGLYRYQGAPGPLTFSTQLYGGAWALHPGHRLHLDVTQDDFPYARPDNLASSVAWDSAQLVLPTAG
jgi:predicted acyl esterase